MLRKEHKKKYQVDHDKDDRQERKVYRKNRVRERTQPEKESESYNEK